MVKKTIVDAERLISVEVKGSYKWDTYKWLPQRTKRFLFFWKKVLPEGLYFSYESYWDGTSSQTLVTKETLESIRKSDHMMLIGNEVFNRACVTYRLRGGYKGETCYAEYYDSDEKAIEAAKSAADKGIKVHLIINC